MSVSDPYKILNVRRLKRIFGFSVLMMMTIVLWASFSGLKAHFEATSSTVSPTRREMIMSEEEAESVNQFRDKVLENEMLIKEDLQSLKKGPSGASEGTGKILQTMDESKLPSNPADTFLSPIHHELTNKKRHGEQLSAPLTNDIIFDESKRIEENEQAIMKEHLVDINSRSAYKASYFGANFPYEAVQERITSKDLGPVIYIDSSEFHNAIKMTSEESKLAAKDFKYFKEASKCCHADRRFYDRTIFENTTDLKEVQGALYKAWYNFCDQKGMISWLAHGTLLGWFWNQAVFPWDPDIDVQMTMHGLEQLSQYNNTILDDRYMVDISFNIINRSRQKKNAIDARFIDIKTGAFIDITGLAHSKTKLGRIMCKAMHTYTPTDISPLHLTEFMGSPAWRPHETMKVLVQEYRNKGVTKNVYHGHYFDESVRIWKPKVKGQKEPFDIQKILKKPKSLRASRIIRKTRPVQSTRITRKIRKVLLPDSDPLSSTLPVSADQAVPVDQIAIVNQAV